MRTERIPCSTTIGHLGLPPRARRGWRSRRSSTDNRRRAVEILDDDAAHLGSDLADIGVVQGHDIEAPAAQPGVVGESAPRPPPDNRDPLPPGYAEPGEPLALFRRPNSQLPHAVEVEMGHIPADTKALAPAAAASSLELTMSRRSQAFQQSQIAGQADDRGLWDLVHKLTINRLGVLGIPAGEQAF